MSGKHWTAQCARTTRGVATIGKIRIDVRAYRMAPTEDMRTEVTMVPPKISANMFTMEVPPTFSTTMLERIYINVPIYRAVENIDIIVEALRVHPL